MNYDKKIIIGGPSRNGKTTLTNLLYKNHGEIIGLPIEGNIPVYYSRTYPFKTLQKNIIINEYIEQDRCVNEERTKFAKPIDYFCTDFKTIIKNTPEKIDHHIQLISYLLGIFAKDHNASTWAVCDLHCEYLYMELKKYIPDLHLIVMLRDPREAICANLYWRYYPMKNNQSQALLEYRTMMWIYTIETFIFLNKLYKNEVSLLIFNKLIYCKKEREKMKYLLDVPGDIISKHFIKKKPDYSFSNRKFLTPDGELMELMTRDELSFVEYYTKPYIEKLKWDILSSYKNEQYDIEKYSKFDIKLNNVLQILKKSPTKAMDYIHSSMDYTKNEYQNKRRNRLKNEIKKNFVNIYSYYKNMY